MRVKVENISPEEASVAVEVPEDGEARMMEALAVTALVNAIDHEGYGPAVKALDESWHGFVTGILGGFYAAHRTEAELAPVFKVLMAMVGVAKDGYASVSKEEYRIVEEEEGERCPSASASDAGGSSSPRRARSIGIGVIHAHARPGRGPTPGTTPGGTGPIGTWTPRSRSTAMWTTIRGPWTTTSGGSSG